MSEGDAMRPPGSAPPPPPGSKPIPPVRATVVPSTQIHDRAQGTPVYGIPVSLEDNTPPLPEEARTAFGKTSRIEDDGLVVGEIRSETKRDMKPIEAEKSIVVSDGLASAPAAPSFRLRDRKRGSRTPIVMVGVGVAVTLAVAGVLSSTGGDTPDLNVARGIIEPAAPTAPTASSTVVAATVTPPTPASPALAPDPGLAPPPDGDEPRQTAEPGAGRRRENRHADKPADPTPTPAERDDSDRDHADPADPADKADPADPADPADRAKQADPADPGELLAKARKASVSGDDEGAYALASHSYAIRHSHAALQIMGLSACKLGDRTRATSAHEKLPAGKRGKLTELCAVNGIELE